MTNEHIDFDYFEDEFEKFFRRIRRRFQEAFSDLGFFEPEEKPLWDAETCCLEPLVEVHNKPEEIVVIADLPFVKHKGDIELNLIGDVLEIKAKLKRPYRFEHWGTVQKDIDFQTFQKHIKLPEEVNPEEVEAVFRNSVLKVTLKKKIKRKRIEIK